MIPRQIQIMLVIFALTLWGCGVDSNPNNDGSDADTDTDSDSDSDADSDSDTDTDADNDADSDADGDETDGPPSSDDSDFGAFDDSESEQPAITDSATAGNDTDADADADTDTDSGIQSFTCTFECLDHCRSWNGTQHDDMTCPGEQRCCEGATIPDSDSDDGPPSSDDSDSGAFDDTESDEPAIADTATAGNDTSDTENTLGDLCDVGVWDGITTPVVLGTRNFGTHDPSIIKDGDTFYQLATGQYVPVATSTNLVDWSHSYNIYGNTYPDWSVDWLAGVSGQTFDQPWAPDVIYFGGQFHVYSTFSAVFGDNISCITHLTADSMSGPWTDHGPIICTEGNERFNAIDADVELDEAGTPWLAFGSFWDGIYGFKLDLDGNRAADDSEMHHLAWNSSIEAPVLFRRCGYYYLFVSWGTCCQGRDSTYNVRVGRSENIMGPYVDKSGTPMIDGGGTLLVAGDGTDFAAAGHSEVLVEGDTIYNVYHAYPLYAGGPYAALRIAEMPFDEDGWPVRTDGP